MKLTAFVSSKQHLQTVALSALACLLFGTMAVQGAPLSIIGVGYRTTSGLAGEMYRFSESGMMLQKSDIVDSRHAISIATFGMNLYVAGFRQAINRYDLHGQFLGQFADVRALAGATVNSPILETDTKGSV